MKKDLVLLFARIFMFIIVVLVIFVGYFEPDVFRKVFP